MSTVTRVIPENIHTLHMHQILLQVSFSNCKKKHGFLGKLSPQSIGIPDLPCWEGLCVNFVEPHYVAARKRIPTCTCIYVTGLLMTDTKNSGCLLSELAQLITGTCCDAVVGD